MYKWTSEYNIKTYGYESVWALERSKRSRHDEVVSHARSESRSQKNPFCGYCGNNVGSNNFCSKCGAKTSSKLNPNNIHHIPSKKKSNKNRNIIIICLSVMIVLLGVGVTVLNMINDYSEAHIAQLNKEIHADHTFGMGSE